MARRAKDDAALLLDILGAAEAARRFVQGLDREAFMASERDQFAITRAVGIVGEAAWRLSPEFRATRPDVAWPAIIGMRHRIVHAYDDIDLEVVWQVATVALPELLLRLRTPPPS
jgi:uncharacterized protein with HEPN domain